MSGKSQEEVREKMAAIKAAQHNGMLADAGGLTLKDYLDRWAEAKERAGVKPNTLRSYRDTARLYLTPTLGRKKLEKLTTLDVEGLLTALQSQGKSAQIMS